MQLWHRKTFLVLWEDKTISRKFCVCWQKSWICHVFRFQFWLPLTATQPSSTQTLFFVFDRESVNFWLFYYISRTSSFPYTERPTREKNVATLETSGGTGMNHSSNRHRVIILTTVDRDWFDAISMSVLSCKPAIDMGEKVKQQHRQAWKWLWKISGWRLLY